MVRRKIQSLGGTLAIAVLVLSACNAGASATASPAGGGASPVAPAATSVTATATPVTATATPVASTAAAVTGPDGRIAFGVRASGGSNIFSMLPDGTDQRQLTTGTGNHLCAAYAADGSRIAYCADAGGHFEIWTMKPDGTQPSQLTHLGGTALFPDFSHDGKKIAFGGVQGDDPNTEIYAVDATTGEGLVGLTSCAGLAHGCSNDYPVWSPDGKSIVYIHTDDYDANENPINAQVWVMHADGSKPHALTKDNLAKDQVPDWSPDGSLIAYAGGTVGNEGIWVMGADGSKPHRISGCKPSEPGPCKAGDDFGPVWSPDGTAIAFLRDFQAVGAHDRPIFTMDADGSHQVRVSQGTILAAVPAWQGSPTSASD